MLEMKINYNLQGTTLSEIKEKLDRQWFIDSYSASMSANGGNFGIVAKLFGVSQVRLRGLCARYGIAVPLR